jgi:hypothetical protein
MPDLILKSTGKPVFVPDEQLADALASQMFEAPDDSTPVNVTLPGALGDSGTTTVGDLRRTQQAGASVESESSFRGRERGARLDREHGGLLDKGITALETGVDEFTLGIGPAILDSTLGEGYRERRIERREANPGVVTGTKIASGLAAAGSAGKGLVGKALGATPLGAVTKAGSKIAARGGVKNAAKAGVLEGGAVGFGEGVQQLRDSDQPIDFERAASVLASNVVLGGGTGGLIGGGAAAAGKALTKAKGALDKAATREIQVADDIARMDGKQLRAAREVELEAIETARIPERKAMADELATFRKDLKDQKVWLATKDSADSEIRTIGKQTLKADKQLDRLLDNPKALAENPARARAALQQQEHALEQLTKKADQLRAAFGADTTPVRAQALDNAMAALERNRGLQQRLADLSAAPSSPRLQALDDAKDALVTGGVKKGMAEQMVGGSAFGIGAGLASAVPVVGPFLAPFAGSAAAKLATEGLSNALGKASVEAAKRMSTAVGVFLDVGKKVAPAAPVLATKVLAQVAYAPSDGSKGGKDLPSLYKARSAEIRSQVAAGPDGKAQMHASARGKMAANLAGIRAADPILADRIETHAARKVAFLADNLPRRPDTGALKTGPDMWQPSDFAMRGWARLAAAAEDPAGIAERLTSGSITPEDAKVMRELYPEMLAALTQNILEQLPTLQAQLPYQRRLALSILTGVPVDPAMNPRILRVLQASFVREPGTEGGTQAPRPQAQFGSVTAAPGTQAQKREQGAMT